MLWSGSVNLRGGSGMINGEPEKHDFGAPKIDPDFEKEIRSEIDKEFPHLTPVERESLIRSRLRISSNTDKPILVQVELGEGASRKIKGDLFE
jgi:hypothetical protein